MSRTAHCTVVGGTGSGVDAGRDAGDFDADDFDAGDFDAVGRDVVRDAGGDADRADRPERDESDEGLLLVGSFSENDLNMGRPIVTR
jgi:hypothetical protein